MLLIPVDRLKLEDVLMNGLVTFSQASGALYIYIYMFVCVYTYIHTHIRTSTHTCIHTNGIRIRGPTFLFDPPKKDTDTHIRTVRCVDKGQDLGQATILFWTGLRKRLQTKTSRPKSWRALRGAREGHNDDHVGEPG